MADLHLIPSMLYPELCLQLRKDCPAALKVLTMLSRPRASSDIKCYTKMVEGKPDAAVVVIKTVDERFQKFGVEQDLLLHVPSQEQLAKVLENKTIVDMSKIVLFRGISNASLDWYETLSLKHQGHFHSMFKLQLYKLKTPRKLSANLPYAAELGPITDPEDIHRLRVSWLYREMVSSEEFGHLMLSDVTVGLFLNASRPHLVSWGVVNLEGAIAFVTTVAEHQHKGYAKLVVSHLCRKLLDQGRIAVAELDERNTRARQLFEELGFCRVAEQQWGFHVPDARPELDKFMRIFHEFTLIEQRAFKPDVRTPSPGSTPSLPSNGKKTSRSPTPNNDAKSAAPVKTAKNATPEKTSKSTTSEKAGKSVTPEKTAKSAKSEKAGKSVTPEKTSKSATSEKTGKSVTPEETSKSATSEKTGKSVTPEKTAKNAKSAKT